MPSFAAGVDDAGVVRLGHDGLLFDRADDIRERLALRTLAHDARLRRVAGPVVWLLDLGIEMTERLTVTRHAVPPVSLQAANYRTGREPQRATHSHGGGSRSTGPLRGK
jgi:hypothetical protein